MPYAPHAVAEPSREEVDRLTGATVLEFGANWCPHCQAAQPALKALLDARPDVRHLKIEDGRGKPLGRSFRVKLWPSIVVMRDGAMLTQVARPSDAELREAIGRLDANSARDD